MADRIQQLREFVNEDPKDPFNLYALALEYQKIDLQKAVEIFGLLTRDHPDYVPTYYQLGKLYHELAEHEKALQVFDSGIEKAQKQNDAKALRELKAARQELLSEE
jgi:tetratricopeptide (TPR) repeat protein